MRSFMGSRQKARELARREYRLLSKADMELLEREVDTPYTRAVVARSNRLRSYAPGDEGSDIVWRILEARRQVDALVLVTVLRVSFDFYRVGGDVS
jgi:hypothetical protein